jgi:predicted ATP-dependent serine protease
VQNKFDFVVLDSLPAITSRKKLNKREHEEYVVTKLITTAKQNETCIGIILHFTKTGTYKGGTLCPHSVDCNIIMTRNEDDYNLRDIDVTKNRFGSSGACVFEMTSRGFTFEAMEEIAPGQKQQEKKPSKRDQVINAINEGASTVAQIAEKSSVNGTYLQTILRELSAEGVVNKQGRGPEATYFKK